MGHYRRYGSSEIRRRLIVICSTFSLCLSSGTLQAQPSPAPEGKGWWLTSSQEWTLLDCPKTLVGEDVVQRLPQGCSALYPAIAYTLQADTLVRQDLAEANVKIKALKEELKLSRVNLLKIQRTTEKALVSSNKALEESLKLNDLQLKTLEDAQSSIFWSRVYSTTALVGSFLLVGAVVIF